MSTPYRSAPPVIDDEDIPDFGNTPHPGRELLWVAVRALPFVVLAAVDRSEKTAFLCGMHLFGFAVVALIIVLERPVRAWFDALCWSKNDKAAPADAYGTQIHNLESRDARYAAANVTLRM